MVQLFQSGVEVAQRLRDGWVRWLEYRRAGYCQTCLLALAATPGWSHCWDGSQQRHACLPLDLFLGVDGRVQILTEERQHDTHKSTDNHRQENHCGPLGLKLAVR